MTIIKGIKIETLTFPTGEVNVKLSKDPWWPPHPFVEVEFIFEGSDSIMELLLACDALKRRGYSLRHLKMDYVPFSRQDRVMTDGEALSLRVFCDMINDLGFEGVSIMDPHSDVTPALLNNCFVEEQHEIFYNSLMLRFCHKPYVLVAPDAGALKKIYKLANKLECNQIIKAQKVRDASTGEIISTDLHCDIDISGMDCVIVDDICDGGRTFIEIAKKLREHNCGDITLCVTHGFFTKGIDVFKGLIDNIYTKEGQIA